MAGEEEDDVQPDSPPGFVNEINSNELEVVEVRFDAYLSNIIFINTCSDVQVDCLIALSLIAV